MWGESEGQGSGAGGRRSQYKDMKVHTEPSPLSMTNGLIHKFVPEKSLTKCVSGPSLGVRGEGRTGLLTDF